MKSDFGNIKFDQKFTVHDFLEGFSKQVIEGYVKDFGTKGWDYLVSRPDSFSVLDLLDVYIKEDFTD